jgi:hypothetical protein
MPGITELETDRGFSRADMSALGMPKDRPGGEMDKPKGIALTCLGDVLCIDLSSFGGASEGMLIVLALDLVPAGEL